jgi:dihydrofolate synthase/folylpolyglutamate synthase
VILAPIHSARAAALDELLAAAEATGTAAVAAVSVAHALQLALDGVPTQPEPRLVVISGSVYLVGEARSLLLDSKSFNSKELSS